MNNAQRTLFLYTEVYIKILIWYYRKYYNVITVTHQNGFMYHVQVCTNQTCRCLKDGSVIPKVCTNICTVSSIHRLSAVHDESSLIFFFKNRAHLFIDTQT